MWAIWAEQFQARWFLDPEDLGEGEVGERGVAGELDEVFAAELRRCSQSHCASVRLIAPNEGGAEDLAVLVEEDGAVHLAGETDGEDDAGGVGVLAGSGERVLDGNLGGTPPVFGVLLGPADLPGADRRVLRSTPRPTARPSRSTSTARVPPVPTSIPRNIAQSRPSISSLADSISIASKVYPLRRGGCMRAASKTSLRKAHRNERQDCEGQLKTENTNGCAHLSEPPEVQVT